MEYIKYVAVALAALALGWLLWETGWLPLTTKRAAVFMGKVYGNRPVRLTRTRATGTLRRTVLLQPGSRTFILESGLTAGTVTATLREPGTGREWTLDSGFPSVTTTVQQGGFGKGWLLVIRFTGASGTATLSWQ